MEPSSNRTSSSSSIFDLPPLDSFPFLDENLDFPFPPEDFLPNPTSDAASGSVQKSDEGSNSNLDFWLFDSATDYFFRPSTAEVPAQARETAIPPQAAAATPAAAASSPSPESVSSPLGSNEELEKRESTRALSLRRKRPQSAVMNTSLVSEDEEIQLSEVSTRKRVTRSAKNCLSAQEPQDKKTTEGNSRLAEPKRIALSEDAKDHAQLWQRAYPTTELSSMGIFDASSNQGESVTQGSYLLEQVLGVVVVEAITNQNAAQNRIRALEEEVIRLRLENTLRAFGVFVPDPSADARRSAALPAGTKTGSATLH